MTRRGGPRGASKVVAGVVSVSVRRDRTRLLKDEWPTPLCYARSEHVGAVGGHGRTEQRTFRATTAIDGNGIVFPHAAQVFRVRHTPAGK